MRWRWFALAPEPRHDCAEHEIRTRDFAEVGPANYVRKIRIRNEQRSDTAQEREDSAHRECAAQAWQAKHAGEEQAQENEYRRANQELKFGDRDPRGHILSSVEILHVRPNDRPGQEVE